MPIALSLTREILKPVRSLSGFKKSFKVPDDAGASNNAFVTKIADAEIDQHLETIHSRLRKHFNFKRKDLVVNQSTDGFGSISTPGFEYSVSVRLNDEDPSEIIWHFEVTEISDPHELVNSSFEKVFDELFDRVTYIPHDPVDLEMFVDRIEAAEDPRMELDYDMNVTKCQMKFEGIEGDIELTSEALSLVQSQPTSPRILLSAFLELHKVMVASSDFEPMA